MIYKGESMNIDVEICSMLGRPNINSLIYETNSFFAIIRWLY